MTRAHDRQKTYPSGGACRACDPQRLGGGEMGYRQPQRHKAAAFQHLRDTFPTARPNRRGRRRGSWPLSKTTGVSTRTPRRTDVFATTNGETCLDERSPRLRLGYDSGDHSDVASEPTVPRERALNAANFRAPVAVRTTLRNQPTHAAATELHAPVPCQNDGCSSGEMRDLVFLDRVSARLNLISRGDVVVLRSPDDDALITKRVVAMGGDTVRHREHGSRLVRVPTAHLWVEGDNGEVGLAVEKSGQSLGLSWSLCPGGNERPAAVAGR